MHDTPQEIGYFDELDEPDFEDLEGDRPMNAAPKVPTKKDHLVAALQSVPRRAWTALELAEESDLPDTTVRRYMREWTDDGLVSTAKNREKLLIYQWIAPSAS